MAVARLSASRAEPERKRMRAGNKAHRMKVRKSLP